MVVVGKLFCAKMRPPSRLPLAGRAWVVPVGTFRAFKVVREANGSIIDEYWYAPDVRWYVKWVGRRGKDEFQEVLQEHMPAPQTAPPRPGDRPGRAQ
jgi:hypothetical protein